MAVSVDYVARETASNLWRNRLMTIAAVLTVAVSLALVGAALLLRQGAAHATTEWQRGVNVVVWLKPGLAADRETAVQKELTQLPYVQSCAYRSQQYDFGEAKHLLPPDESQVLNPQSTPASLRCVLQDPRQAQAVIDQFQGQPGIQAVTAPTQAIRNMEHVTRVLQITFVVIAIVLLLSASVLILNTIRLAIFARRREVSVMKLVGATNWFIRIPFMCEGLVQGLLGALVAALVVVGLHLLLDSFANGSQNSVLYQMRLSTGDVVVTSVVVMLVGLFVGTVGSVFAIRRFLDT